ncbi:universal stress protein [Loigolactobacillus coryniformis]|uniref:UspA domain-containing protein n=1 Tax=Loigolactobacillus coryniformis subsp. coryniformis KCTC 3167 = DSM 20001 TaxID=913848 RepID=A0A0R1EYM3_9LACO|nr:universal stress protein [Loigolactobacillus coryniformis]ATO55807.1 universal stress protein UspA [Loigolactobacillus coryniformis subsp. coryniformis KCTC 3167 = DSM 20001]KRK14677.1 UspA domain-containing protein [Loigolactobacillus coryniformis subsp. coryniformis KCTC 3167 = DSM 20001]
MQQATYLVAVDGSKNAERAFQAAVDLATVTGAQLTLLYVINDRGYDKQRFEAEYLRLIDAEHQLAEELLNTYQKTAQQQHINVQQAMVYGYPKEQIVTYSRDNQPTDLIFLGATGNNAFEDGELGATASYVIRHAAANIFLVK